jgi:hypothetical protein
MAYPQNYPGMYPVDPIDSLQTLFDLWKTSVGTGKGHQPPLNGIRVYRSGSGEIVVDLMRSSTTPGGSISIMDVSGRVILTVDLGRMVNRISTGDRLKNGIYIYRVADGSGAVVASGKLCF